MPLPLLPLGIAALAFVMASGKKTKDPTGPSELSPELQPGVIDTAGGKQIWRQAVADWFYAQWQLMALSPTAAPPEIGGGAAFRLVSLATSPAGSHSAAMACQEARAQGLVVLANLANLAQGLSPQGMVAFVTAGNLGAASVGGSWAIMPPPTMQAQPATPGGVPGIPTIPSQPVPGTSPGSSFPQPGRPDEPSTVPTGTQPGQQGQVVYIPGTNTPIQLPPTIPGTSIPMPTIPGATPSGSTTPPATTTAPTVPGLPTLPGIPGATSPTDPVVAQMPAILAGTSPEALEEAADALDRQGYHAEAEQCRARAKQLRAGQGAADMARGHSLFTIRSGDIPSNMAKYYTGDAQRFRDIPPLNPGMQVVHRGNGTFLEPWRGTVKLPLSWAIWTKPLPLQASGGAPTAVISPKSDTKTLKA